MKFNFIEQLGVNGHLTISKVYKDGSEEIIFDDHNIIVSGMGVALAHMFALSGSDSILDYQIDRFQLGYLGHPDYEVSTTTGLTGPLSSASEYAGTDGDVLTASGYKIINNEVVNFDTWYGIITQQHVTRIDSNTVRYTIVIDEESCNNLTRLGSSISLNEIGLFVKNIKSNEPVAPILVAYRVFSDIRKTSDFSLIFRWSLNF